MENENKPLIKNENTELKLIMGIIRSSLSILITLLLLGFLFFKA